jgi:Outer membrane efflux protein
MNLVRNLLGLSPADSRQIIPITPQHEELVNFDWDSCLQEMLEYQPDVVQQRILARVAELQLLLARNHLLPKLSLNGLYQLNTLGQEQDRSDAVMFGAILDALRPVLDKKEGLAGPDCNVRDEQNFVDCQFGFACPLPMRGPLNNTRQARSILLRSLNSIRDSASLIRAAEITGLAIYE